MDLNIPDRLMTSPEVAEIIGVHKVTVRRWIITGRLRTLQMGKGGHHKILPQDLKDALRSRESSE